MSYEVFVLPLQHKQINKVMNNKFYKKLPNGDMVEMTPSEYIAFSDNNYSIPRFLTVLLAISICGILIDYFFLS